MRPMKCESIMDRTGTLHLDKVVYPKLGSPKFDGNRCYVEDGAAKSSTGKPIRNNYIRNVLSTPELEGFDCEIVVGPPTAKNVRRRTSSGVSSFGGEPDFGIYVFDTWDLDSPFEERLDSARERIQVLNLRHVNFVLHELITDEAGLLRFEKNMLDLGYEGVVLRDPLAPYKQGRSTLNQNWALKLKRFVDSEAVIVGYEEMFHNENEATLDDHGYTKRSSHGENKIPAGCLGALVVQDVKTGVIFKVGSGFDMLPDLSLPENERFDRHTLWQRRRSLPGLYITYKHFPVGAKDKPNLPGFVDFRSPDDILPDPEEAPF